MFWLKKKNLDRKDSMFSTYEEDKIKVLNKNKGKRLYSNDYSQFYVYLTSGCAKLQFINVKPVTLEAAPLWKMHDDVFLVNEKNAYIDCESDCQFLLIGKD